MHTCSQSNLAVRPSSEDLRMPRSTKSYWHQSLSDNPGNMVAIQWLYTCSGCQLPSEDLSYAKDVSCTALCLYLSISQIHDSPRSKTGTSSNINCARPGADHWTFSTGVTDCAALPVECFNLGVQTSLAVACHCHHCPHCLEASKTSRCICRPATLVCYPRGTHGRQIHFEF